MQITLTSFFDGDRSGKIRWLAHELGIDVVEDRIRWADTQEDAFAVRSPLRVVPLVQMSAAEKGRTRCSGELRESTATCQVLVEAFGPHLGVSPGDPLRADYLIWLATFAENVEQKLVECTLSRGGRLPPEVFAMQAPRLRERLEVLAARLPEEGYLLGTFTLADIVAAYSFRLALGCDLLDRSAVDPWWSLLLERPAARRANFFAGLDS